MKRISYNITLVSSISQVVVKTKSDKARKAKETLLSFVKIIDEDFKIYFDSEIKNVFGVSNKERLLAKKIWGHIKEHNLRPAKRLRGSFIYYGYQLLGGKDKASALDAAKSIELIHTALLMHDDFMDQDDTRRGKPTTHEHFSKQHKNNSWRFSSEHYGHSMAVDVGDIALLAGYEILGRSRFPEKLKLNAINRMLRGVVNTGFGQAYDVTLEAHGKASEKDIVDLHYAKTSIYTYENPLHTGAVLAHASEADLDIISKYAIPGGVAFQLQDDILGLYGDPEKTGKPAHSDLRQGKMTLLIIEALKRADSKQHKRLLEIWGNRELTEAEAQEARKIVQDTGSLDYSIKTSVRWAKKAQKAIPEMISKKWDKEAIDYLDGIAQYMVERDL